jgi:hypothetical protein
MPPAPDLADLIATVRADAGSGDPLAQLAAAARTAADLEETADGVLSHFVDQCRRAGRSWSEISKALGVTKQAAHKRFSFAPSLDRFTPRAVTMLERAPKEASALGHGYVGTEHLLLALFFDPQTVAAIVLADAGVTRDEVEARLLAITPRGSAQVTVPPFTPRAATATEKAMSEALQLGHNYIGTEHILLALFADPDGLAAALLTDLGATYDDLRRRIVDKLAGRTG